MDEYERYAALVQRMMLERLTPMARWGPPEEPAPRGDYPEVPREPKHVTEQRLHDLADAVGVRYDEPGDRPRLRVVGE